MTFLDAPPRGETDVLVIGGGMAGLSAAYYLRRSGPSVRLLEARTIGNPQGSSFGASRMYREMYSDSYYCERSKEANRLWAEMEWEHGVELRQSHGLLFYGESWDEETIEGSIPGARKVMDEQGIPYEALDAGAIADRWPIQPRSDFEGLFEPTAGAVRANIALNLWVHACRASGVELVEGAPVRALDPTSSGVTAVLAGGQKVRAQKVILAAGPWSQGLLRQLGLDLHLEVWGMLWAHYKVDIEHAHRYPQWFCFMREDAARRDGGLYYGFPSMDGTPRIKAGIDWAPPELRSAQPEEKRDIPGYLLELLDGFMHTHLRGVGRRLDAHLSPYTMTPDVGFVLDQIPGAKNICLFTGGSGQAFKFAPLIGAVLSDLALDKPPRTDIRPWRIDRPALAPR